MTKYTEETEINSYTDERAAAYRGSGETALKPVLRWIQCFRRYWEAKKAQENKAEEPKQVRIGLSDEILGLGKDLFDEKRLSLVTERYKLAMSYQDKLLESLNRLLPNVLALYDAVADGIYGVPKDLEPKVTHVCEEAGYEAMFASKNQPGPKVKMVEFHAMCLFFHDWIVDTGADAERTLVALKALQVGLSDWGIDVFDSPEVLGSAFAEEVMHNLVALMSGSVLEKPEYDAGLITSILFYTSRLGDQQTSAAETLRGKPVSLVTDEELNAGLQAYLACEMTLGDIYGIPSDNPGLIAAFLAGRAANSVMDLAVDLAGRSPNNPLLTRLLSTQRWNHENVTYNYRIAVNTMLLELDNEDDYSRKSLSFFVSWMRGLILLPRYKYCAKKGHGGYAAGQVMDVDDTLQMKKLGISILSGEWAVERNRLYCSAANWNTLFRCYYGFSHNGDLIECRNSCQCSADDLVKEVVKRIPKQDSAILLQYVNKGHFCDRTAQGSSQDSCSAAQAKDYVNNQLRHIKSKSEGQELGLLGEMAIVWYEFLCVDNGLETVARDQMSQMISALETTDDVDLIKL